MRIGPPMNEIVGPSGRRLTPSGLDVATMFGNALARSPLSADFAAYARFGPRARRDCGTSAGIDGLLDVVSAMVGRARR